MPRRSLRPRAERFVREYLTNGYNATAAYKAAHPRCTQRTAEVNGSKSLRKTDVVARLAQHFQEGSMSGEEALARISNLARGDVRQLFNKTGSRLLPISDWPPEVAARVKAIKPGKHGTTIILHDALRAAELMATAAGRLRQGVDHAHVFRHETYLGAEPPAGGDE